MSSAQSPITGTGSLELSLQGSLVGALDEELFSLGPYRWESIVRTASRVIAAIAVQHATPGGLDEARARQLEADLAKLGREQRWDGGWSWCHSCKVDLWVTGWVLIALGEAHGAGHAAPGTDPWRAANLIWSYVHQETDVERPADPNQHAYLMYAMASASSHVGWLGEALEQQGSAMRAIVEEHRADLTNWGRAYLLLGLLATGHGTDHAAVRILLNDLTANTIASANGNHWEDERIAGSLHNGRVRTTAIVLRALTEVDPRHALIEETARWLAYARSVSRWKTDVERAQGMASLGAYAGLTGETRGVYDYSVLVNTTKVLGGDFDVPAGDYRDAASVALADLPLGAVSRVQFDREVDSVGRLYYGLNLRYVTPGARCRGVEPRLRRLAPLLAAGRPRRARHQRLRWRRGARRRDGRRTRGSPVRQGRGLPARRLRADRPAAEHRLAPAARAAGSGSRGGAARRRASVLRAMVPLVLEPVERGAAP